VQSCAIVQQRHLQSKMAENPKNESALSPQNSDSNDTDYQLTADMMIHDIDDERTIEEEEMMESTEDFSNEVNSLQKEGEMPIEDLLALYGYGGEGEQHEVPLEEIRPEPLPSFPSAKTTDEQMKNVPGTEKEDDSRSVSSESSRLSAAQSSNSHEENGFDPFQNQRITRGIASLHAQYFEQDESTDDEYQPLPEDWRKDVAVGPEYQAVIPEGLFHSYDHYIKVYENEDKLLWKPDVVDNRQLKKYLNAIFSSPEGEMGTPFRDDEQALYLLMQCGSVDEAMRRRGEQSKLPPAVSLWSEEECRSFELGLRMYGKDFRQIQRNKISHRKVGEIVQFYYLWKKTERYDTFCSQTRFGKKKYGAPGIADYMDRFMDEAESVMSSRSASPYSQMHVGNSSPAPEVEKQATPSQHVTQSKSLFQAAVNNRPIAPSAPKSVSPSSQYAPHVNIEHNITPTQSDVPRLSQQDSYSSSVHSFVPPTCAQTPASVNSVKATGVMHYPGSASTHSVPNFSDSSVSVFHIPSHLSTAGITATDGVGLANANSLTSVGQITNSWSNSANIPLLNADLFNSTKHGVFNTNPNVVNQRPVSFAGAGYAAGSISQSVE